MKHWICMAALLLSGGVMAAGDVKPDITAPIRCGDKWDAGHLQGLDGDATHLYWSFTHKLVKTDLQGNVVKEAPFKKEKNSTRVHGGDPCVVDGIVYIPFCGGAFNEVPKDPVNVPLYVQLYDTELNYIKSYHVPEVQYGIGGMTYANGHFYIVGGRPWQMTGNRVQEFDKDFRFIRSYELPVNTTLGIQTIAFDGTYFYIGCYNYPDSIYRTDANFQNLQYFKTNFGAFGMVPLQNGKMLYATSRYIYEGEKRFSISEGKIFNPDECVKKVNIMTLDAKGNMTFNGEKVDVNRLRDALRKTKSQAVVIRCTSDVSITSLVAVRAVVTGYASRDVEVEILP